MVAILFACQDPGTNSSSENPPQQDSQAVQIMPPDLDTAALVLETAPPRDTSALERRLIKQGLVNFIDYAPEAIIDMKYSTKDNFMAEDVYEDFAECYLQKEVAERLSKAQDLIMAKHPRIRLLIYDCVRPRTVQHKMWEVVKDSYQKKYVAAPGGGGSMHNYGAAVDLGLVHLDTGVVDMGTDFDFFGELAQPRYEEKFVAEGVFSKSQLVNRRIMRAALLEVGFHGILSEWWHFVGFPRDTVRARYKIVE
ncbi:MAG: M15 family metallopeptidase [Bacteroidota bacterium]